LISNKHDFENDIIACAGIMSKRYKGNKDRNQLLERVAVELFDRTKKMHGMGRRERLLLRIAALLNDCGKYMSLEAAAECGYSIIMATEMIGLSHAEREIVANVVKFNKTHFEYYEELATATLLERESYLKIAKLTAIFRVADGICRSYRTKVRDVKLRQKGDELIITVDTDEDITLEQGFFSRKAAFFEEVFSIRPVLKYKKKLSAV
ncbi:MAG TPA: exopolyphosphatase, partial [Lachnospiraceae bacterium]|nr:exopolyphosphatase [Lachnospiraceae bacterium]